MTDFRVVDGQRLELGRQLDAEPGSDRGIVGRA